MSGSTNGRPGGSIDSTRRLRYDFSAFMEQARGWPGGGAASEPGTSGRRFVIVAVIVVLLVWGSLYVVFRQWRSHYRERAAYGANQVAPTIDAFTVIVPTDIDPEQWRDAVARTHAMIVTVTASNLLGMEEMRELRGVLEHAADRARADPETAVAELAAVWDDLTERGEFLIRDTRSLKEDRHPRPAILPSYGEDRVAPALDPMAGITPSGVDPERWRDAVARTRAFLLDVCSSRRISTMRMKALRKDLDRAVARASSHPETAVAGLADIWDSLARSCHALFHDEKAVLSRHSRPELFPSSS